MWNRQQLQGKKTISWINIKSMPIEIRELVIKATVAPTGASQAAGSAGGTSGDDNNVSGQEGIINACVEKIMEILKEKHER